MNLLACFKFSELDCRANKRKQLNYTDLHIIKPYVYTGASNLTRAVDLNFVFLEHLVLILYVIKPSRTSQQRLQEPSFNDWCNQPPNSFAGITPVKESSTS